MTTDRRRLPNKLLRRPVVGSIVIPYMVNESRDPIDFKQLDRSRVQLCVTMRRCGICGTPIKSNQRYAFLGPARELLCFADPWMHEDCARYTIKACPFASGRNRHYRSGDGDDDPLLSTYEGAWELVIARRGTCHIDNVAKAFHFQPVDIVERVALG